jgi:hypothetical protein
MGIGSALPPPMAEEIVWTKQRDGSPAAEQ